ncbi:MAG: hypothetical protein M1561_03085 [Gammaproteobacteria bacterium]|nr:hypothetical protein [Gammaproteobacteria bacterium]
MKKLIKILLVFFACFIVSVYAADKTITPKIDILNALWLKTTDKLPLAVKITSPALLGKRVEYLLDTLLKHNILFVEKYSERYALFKSMAAKGLTTKQAYNMFDLMGQDYFNGFATMNNVAELKFPEDHGAHLNYQVGWYFFAGNFTDKKGIQYGVLCLLFRRALFPPYIAKQLGLTDLENQIVDVQFGVTLGDKKIHVQGHDAVIDGTSGLIKYQTSPFLVAVGNDKFQSLNKATFLPLAIKFKDAEIPLSVDLVLTGSKPILLQGDNGKAPSIYGLGSWYYSIPDIKAHGTISYQGVSREVSGKMWMDNQWMAGIIPPGYADKVWIRALANIVYSLKGKAPEGWAWDWTEVQFDDDTEVTFSAMHSTHSEDLHNIGAKPPGRVTRTIAGGKYNPKNGKAEDITGEVTLTDWVKSPVSGAWYPCGWEVSIPDKGLHFKMTPLIKNQFMYFGNAAEYKEGAVLVTGTKKGLPVHGVGFGESVGYSGQAYYLGTKTNLLGVENSAKNRDLFANHPPSFWLLVQSVLFFALPLLLLIGVIVYLIRMWRR